MDPLKPLYSRREVFRLSFLRSVDGLETLVRRTVEKTFPSEERSLPKATPPKPVYVRPPGALPEKEFLKKCTQCDDCIKACPHFVIRKAGYELGKSVSGTPIIIPTENPCLMCDGFACIASCKTGALIPFPENTLPSIGTAIVDETLCYLAQGQPCDYCTKHCPEKPKAISSMTIGEMAIVEKSACTGCGFCAQICPANAIWIQDRRES